MHFHRCACRNRQSLGVACLLSGDLDYHLLTVVHPCHLPRFEWFCYNSVFFGHDCAPTSLASLNSVSSATVWLWFRRSCCHLNWFSCQNLYLVKSYHYSFSKVMNFNFGRPYLSHIFSFCDLFIICAGSQDYFHFHHGDFLGKFSQIVHLKYNWQNLEILGLQHLFIIDLVEHLCYLAVNWYFSCCFACGFWFLCQKSFRRRRLLGVLLTCF